MVATFLLWAICTGILVAASLAMPDAPAAPGRALVWDHPADAFRRPAWRGLGNYRLLSALLLAAVVILYLVVR